MCLPVFPVQNLIKIILSIYCVFTYISPAYAKVEVKDSILSFIQRAMNFNTTVPQEKVYLHFDNTGYFMNETMWFKAYVTRTDMQKATDLSRVLYVELLNPSGDVIKTHKYHIDDKGQAHGDILLDSIYGSGFYEVRAYTRYMTNWGANACFSRVFPVFKAPKKEGDYSDLTMIKDVELYCFRRPNFRDQSDPLYTKAVQDGFHSNDVWKTISVDFYPEGGDMVVGKKCRVAMMAVDDNGHPYQGTGYVQNAEGTTLASVTTDTLGRGVFDIIPDGSDLTFQMKNLKKSVKRGTQFFSMPKARKEGCALTLNAIGENLRANLQFTDSLVGKTIGYVVMNNGNITYCDTMQAASLVELELDRSKQKPGVNQLTLFGSNGRILAERLFFVCPESNASDSISISTSTRSLKPCGKVEVDIQAEPNSSLSFSAMDATTMNNGLQGNIKTWMLLSSEVRGYIHNVDYYFEADDAEHRKAADLLMLTQGWRRYDWELMTGLKDFETKQPIEDKLYVNGQLREYRKKNKRSFVKIDNYLFNKDGQSLSGQTVTDKDGNFAFALPNVDGEWNMQVFTRINGKRKTFQVCLDRLFSPKPRYVTKLESSPLHPVMPNLFGRNTLQPIEEEFIPITKKDQLLENVTVKAKRRYFTNDDFLYKNEAFGQQHASLYYNADRELDKILDEGKDIPDLMKFVYEKVDGTLNFYDPYYQIKHRGRDVEFIIENNGWSIKPDIGSIFLDEVKSIYISFNGKKSNFLTEFGESGSNIYAYVYLHHKFTTESQKGLRRTYFQGFNRPSTFKMEDYSVLPPMADFRRTIYWDPDVRTDKDGRAKVEFYNNSTCTEMYISTEGMSDNGQLLTNE